MGAMILKCHKCGRNYAVNNIKDTDIHRCECGTALTWKDNYIGSCETANMPNEPHGKKGLTKKITIDVEAGKGFDELLRIVKELRESIEDIPGLVMIDNEGNINAVPVISVDSKMILFKTTGHYHKDYRKKLAEEYTNKLGIRCEVIDNVAELIAVIDG